MYKNIEMLRFIFALIIANAHLLMGVYFYNDTIRGITLTIGRSQILVEFFFILSGFFFARSVIKYNFLEFIIKTVKRIYPVLIVFCLLLLILHAYNVESTDIVDVVLILTFLNTFGITEAWGLTSWYISALFASYLFYLILFHCIKNEKVFYGIVFIVFLSSFAAFYYKFGYIGGINHSLYGYIPCGFLRGVLGFAAGILTSALIKNYFDIIKKFLNNYTLSSILEFALLIAIIKYCIFYDGTIRNNVFIPIFILIIILFVVKSGFISNLLENNISLKLGRYSFSIYLLHFLIIKIFIALFYYKNISFAEKYSIIVFLMFNVSILIISILSYHIVEMSLLGRKIVFCMLSTTLMGGVIFEKMPLSYDTVYKFNSIQPKIKMTSRSGIDWAAWAIGYHSTLSFNTSVRGGVLHLNLFPYIPNNIQRVHVHYENDVYEWVFKKGEPTPATRILLKPQKEHRIHFFFPDCISPMAMGFGPDLRKLSVAFVDLMVTEK